MLSICLSLCACGGAGTDEKTMDGGSGIGIDPQTETQYAEKTARVLSWTAEKGIKTQELKVTGPVMHSGEKVTEYSYDEFGDVIDRKVYYKGDTMAEWTWDAEIGVLESVYDDAGRQTAIVKKGMKLHAWKSREIWEMTGTCYFEEGILVRQEKIADDSGFKVSETTYEYHPNGCLKCEYTKKWAEGGPDGIITYEDPLIEYTEFDENQHATAYHCETLFSAKGSEPYDLIVQDYRWTMDEAGRPVTLDLQEGFYMIAGNGLPMDELPLRDYDVEHVRTAEMRYDDEGRMVSASVSEQGKPEYSAMDNSEPVETEYTYIYGEDGLMTGCRRVRNGNTEETEYIYDDNGFISCARTGKKITDYSWEKDGDRLIGMAYNDSNDVFPSNSAMYANPDQWQDGELTGDFEYKLQPSALTLEPVYVEYEKYLGYRDESVLQEVTGEEPASAAVPGAESAAAAAAEPAAEEEAPRTPEDYLPVLNDSYCGIPVPVPTKEKRLVGAYAKFMDQSISVEAEFEYSDDGSFLRVVDRFDPVGCFTSPKWQTKDEEGRLTGYNEAYGFGTSTEYIYGDDPDVYTMIKHLSFRDETDEIRIEDARISSWIRKAPKEAERAYKYTINEDGLVIRRVTTDASGKEFSEEFEYIAGTYDNGQLYCVEQEQENGFGQIIMTFDRDGYLTYYFNRVGGVNYTWK